MRTAFAVGDAPAGAKSHAFGKGQLWSQDQLFGRAHPARHSTDVGKSSLGALLRERKVTGRDASLPAPLLSASLELVARETVGALPQTPAGTLSLHPARGRRKGTKSPLDPFWAPRLERVSAALWDSGVKPGSQRPSPACQSPHPRYTDSTAAPSAGQYPAACSEYPPPAHSHWQSPAA